MTDDEPYRPRRAVIPDDASWDDDWDESDDDLDDTDELDDTTVPRLQVSDRPVPDRSSDHTAPSARETSLPLDATSFFAGLTTAPVEPVTVAAPDAESEPYVPALSFDADDSSEPGPTAEDVPAHEPETVTKPENVTEPETAAEPENAEPTAETVRVGEPRTARFRGRRVLAGLAALLVVVIAMGYTGLHLAGTGVALGPVAASSQAPSPTPASTGPAVTEQSLLDPTQAHTIDGTSTWAIARTQTGRDAHSPVPTCLTPAESGDLAPQTTLLRTLTAPGERGLEILHEVDAYADRDVAMRAFVHTAQQLGGCATDGAFLIGSTSVEGLGNQAITVTLSVATGTAKPVYHTVLLVRTGRVVNIVDIFANDSPVPPGALATALGPVVNRQCVDADGLCAQTPAAADAVPPVGIEVPGLPSLADVPRLPTMTGHWSATEPVRNGTLPEGSQCERLTNDKAKPTSYLSRAYLVADDDVVPATYGWDLVVFTFADAGAATAYTDEVRASVDKCSDRQRTAKVSAGTTFGGTGADKTTIAGYSWMVRQPTSADANQYVDYRIGLAVAGSKVVYLFLPLDGRNNFTDAQWNALVVRAAQRATQLT